MYTCRCCGANVDSGELVGDICEDCYIDQQEKAARYKFVENMLYIDVESAQMSIGDFIEV